MSDINNNPDNAVDIKQIEEKLEEVLRFHLQKLSENEEKFRIFLESIPALIMAYDSDENLLYANPKLESMTGYSLMEIFHKGFKSKVYKDDVENYVKLFHKTLKSEGEILDFRFLDKNGKCNWLRGLFAPISLKTGKTGILICLFDINEIKQLELDLDRSRYFKKFFEVHPDIIFLHYLDGHILDCNKNACVKLKYQKEELLGKNLSFLGLSVEKKSLLDSIAAEHISRLGLISRIISKDGYGLNVKIENCLIEEGENPVYMSIIRETSSQTQERIEDGKDDFYKMLINSAPVGIITFNPEGQYTSCNEEFLKMLAYEVKRDEVLSWNLYNLSDRDKIWPGFVKALEGEYVGYIRDYMPTPSHQKFSFYQVFAPLKNDNNEIVGVLGLLNEITDTSIIPQNFVESEEKYRKVFENLKDIYLIHNTEGKISTFNPNASNVLGYLPEEIASMKIMDLFVEKDSEELEDHFFNLYSFGSAEYDSKMLSKAKNILDVHIIGKGIEISGLQNFLEIIRVL